MLPKGGSIAFLMKGKEEYSYVFFLPLYALRIELESIQVWEPFFFFKIMEKVVEMSGFFL